MPQYYFFTTQDRRINAIRLSDCNPVQISFPSVRFTGDSPNFHRGGSDTIQILSIVGGSSRGVVYAYITISDRYHYPSDWPV